MKITPDAETVAGRPYELNIQLSGQTDKPGPPNVINIDFSGLCLTPDEESELSAWLLKLQKRMHAERPPFSFQTESLPAVNSTNAPD